MTRMSRFVVFVFLLFALQMHATSASSQTPMPTGEVFIILEGFDQDIAPLIKLEKTSPIDKWGGYRTKAGHYSEENQTVRFHSVPYGTFRFFILVQNCTMRTIDFSFGEGIKKTEITFDAQGCNFVTLNFSS